MDGRVKTLHPRLYAGLLARRDEEAHLGAGRRAGDRAGRPRVREPVPVRADRRPRRRERAGGRREHRHRRPHDDPGGGQEQRVRGRRGRPRATTRACSPSCASPTAGCRWTRATGSPPRPSPAPPATTPRSPRWFAARTYEGFPPAWRDAYEKVSDLRYGENPHQRAAFYARVGAPTHLLDGVRAAARQGAVVQQPARPQLRARARRGVRRPRVRDRQAQQPLRLRGRRRAAGRPTSAPSRATRRAPTAA